MMARSRAVALAVCLTFAAVPVLAATFTVTNTNDSGPGSLRQAMLDARAAVGNDTIVFAIGSGHQVIRPLSPLPVVTDYLFIDGSTQPGYAGTPLIEIDGSLEGAPAWWAGGIDLRIGGIRALAIHSFAGTAVKLQGPAHVRGCYIGTDATGTQARPNQTGVQISSNSSDPTPSRIGGTDPIDGNLFGANSTALRLDDGGYVDGNRFGTNAAGTALLGSNSTHIYIATFSEEGPVFIGENNENFFSGGEVAIDINSRTSVKVAHNLIGMSHSGARFRPRTGVSVYNTSNHVIAANRIDVINTAVSVAGVSLRNIIRQNDIVGSGFGIDLQSGFSGGAHTPNDPGDVDTGPNNFVNHPVLTKVTSLAGTTTIEGTYSGVPNRAFTIDFYRAAACHPSGYGNGSWLASIDVTTDGAGNATFSHSLTMSIPPGHAISATATTVLEGTSEFSACRGVEGHGVVAFGTPNAFVMEGSNAFLTVVRTHGSAGNQIVTWMQTGGNARPGVDGPAGGTVSFAEGVTSVPLNLHFPDNAVYQGNRTYEVSLTHVVGGAAIGTPATATITLIDNDPQPTLKVPQNTQVAEGNSGTTTVSVPVTLSGAASMPITVSYNSVGQTAAANVDFVAVSGAFTFAPGETQKSIELTINGDTLYEFDESFYVQLRSDHTPTVNSFVTIKNDDARPKISVEHVQVVETDRTHTIEVPVTATAPFTGFVSISVTPRTAAWNVDFSPVDSFVQFRNETRKTVRVRIVGDDITEPDETFIVSIDSADADIGQRTATGVILNDDTGVGPSNLSIPLGGGAPIAIDIGEPLAQPVTISVVSSDPATVSVPASVVLPAGQSAIHVEALALKAPSHATITVTMPAELEGDVFTIAARTYIAAKLVFDPATLSLYAGQTARVKVRLEPAAAEELTIALTTDSSGVTIPKSVTIPPGGTGTFTLEAAKVGSIYVRAQMPRAYGERDAMLFGVVSETPATPTILRISPPDGPSAGGTTVELHGANFARDCALTFGGAPATGVQFVTAAMLTAITPAHEAGTVDVVLTCGERRSTFERGFTYTDSSPTLSHVAPSTGNVAGGTHVRIAGTNLRSSCWPFFDGVPAPSATLESATAMLAVTPPHAANAVDVLLRCTGGNALLDDGYFYTPAEEPAASIMTVTPLAAAPGEEVTITGTRFRPTDRVAFTMPLAKIVRTAPDKHVVVVPEVNAQRYSIDVIDLAGRTTTTGPIFHVLEPTRPRITALAPKSAPAGAEIELQGEGFRAGYTFSVAGKPAAIVSSSYTRAIVRLPNDLAPGAYEVEIINSAGVLASIGPKVTIVSAGLSITGISRTCTTTSGGGSITVNGTGFEGSLLVTFGATMATDVTIVDATTLTMTVPAGEAGPAQIRIVRGDGASATWTSGFRYVSPFDPTGCGGPPSRGRSVRH